MRPRGRTTGRRIGRPVGQDLSGPKRLELFVVAALCAILVTRAYLELLDYPQLGGGGLHIAHALWGALLMLCGQLLLLGFLRPAIKDISAVVGGVGFGLTLDEVGKFVTADNDYFFRPTFAIVYAVFVSIVLAIRWLSEPDPRDPATLLANAVNLAESGLFRRMTEARHAEALRLIDVAAARGADETMVRATRRFVEACEPADPEARRYAEVPGRLRRLADVAVRSRAALVVACLLLALIVVDTAVSTIPELLTAAAGRPITARTVQLGIGVVMAVLITAGFARWSRDRRGGIRMLRYAVLLNILVGQVFNFAHRQLAGLSGVVLGIGLLVVLDRALKPEADGEPGSRPSRPA